jgi:hypothetical protein
MAVIDLNNIKERIRTIFNTANTTTASVDLSASMTNRVNRVLKLNPLRLPIQASLYPLVTVFIDQKTMESATIARSQTDGKRRCTVSIKVVGAVWNANITDINEDPADEDLENLMENAEQILRNNPDINSTVTWAVPESCTYHETEMGEDAHLRAAILTLNGTVFY